MLTYVWYRLSSTGPRQISEHILNVAGAYQHTYVLMHYNTPASKGESVYHWCGFTDMFVGFQMCDVSCL